MDYQGQNPNLGETANTPNVSGGENPFLPPTRDMGELGHSIIDNTPSMEEVMDGPIEVVELEQPPLMPGEMSVEKAATESAAVDIATENIMSKNTISQDTAKEAKKIEDEAGKAPHEALKRYNDLNSRVILAVTSRAFGADMTGDKAA